VVLRDAKERVDPDEQSVTHRIIALNGSVRHVNQQSSSHGSYLVASARYPYLIRGNCIYLISDGWDSQKQDLRPEFRKYLSDGSVSPDFCFPWKLDANGGTAIFHGESNQPERVRKPSCRASIQKPFTYSRTISAVAD